MTTHCSVMIHLVDAEPTTVSLVSPDHASLYIGCRVSLGLCPAAELRTWLTDCLAQLDAAETLATDEQNRAGVAAAKATLPHAESQQVAS